MGCAAHDVGAPSGKPEILRAQFDGHRQDPRCDMGGGLADAHRRRPPRAYYRAALYADAGVAAGIIPGDAARTDGGAAPYAAVETSRGSEAERTVVYYKSSRRRVDARRVGSKEV